MPRTRRLLGLTIGASVVASAAAIPAFPLDPSSPAPALVAAQSADDSATNDETSTSTTPPRSGLGVQLDRIIEIVRDAAEFAVTTDRAMGDTTPDADPPEPKKKKAKKKEKPSPRRKLRLVKTISGGGLSPKSIVADQNGQFFTMNMMYSHNITVFDKAYKRAKVIDDSVDLSKFGFKRYRDKVQGAPVEAAVSRNGKKVYVSNYTMYGPGFPNQGFDLCTPRDKVDRGFVYEIDTGSLRKTDVIQVGRVPKYLAIAPNGRHMLVGNWCSWDISVVDLKKNKEIKRIDAGVAPRGIAFSPNGKTAYVTLVGEHRILVIDMDTFTVKRDIKGLGKRPRHLVMSPNGRYLYITIQGEDKPKKADGRILKYDTRARKVVARSKPLVEPRTTVMADDGKSLYVVDYHPGTIVKLKASNLSTLESKYLGYHPIGVTYDNDSDKVWVAGYGGSVWVLKDK